jgi:hypothetical protein
VLWVGGLGLIVFALWLLAVEIGQRDAARLMWVCFVYAALLWATDWALRGLAGLRLLSSTLVFGVGACVTLGVIAWQGTVGQPTYFRQWSEVPYWSRPEVDPAPIFAYHPLIHGVYLPVLTMSAVSLVLLRARGFLPAWLALAACVLVVAIDFGEGLELPQLSWVVLACVLGLVGAGWYADLTQPTNHGFWLNKAGMAVFPFYALLAVLTDDVGWVVGICSILVVAVSIFIRRPSGIAAGAFGLALFFGGLVARLGQPIRGRRGVGCGWAGGDRLGGSGAFDGRST